MHNVTNLRIFFCCIVVTQTWYLLLACQPWFDHGLTFHRNTTGLYDRIAAFILGAFDKLRRPQKVNELIKYVRLSVVYSSLLFILPDPFLFLVFSSVRKQDYWLLLKALKYWNTRVERTVCFAVIKNSFF